MTELKVQTKEIYAYAVCIGREPGKGLKSCGIVTLPYKNYFDRKQRYLHQQQLICPHCGGAAVFDGIRSEELWLNTITKDDPLFNLTAHIQRQRDFSERTFGPGQRTKGLLDHIRKELIEIESAPNDLMEWVDLILLALDGAWRAGFTSHQICKAIDAKQTRNESRKWPDWRTTDTDKAIEHDRNGERKEEPDVIKALPSAQLACVEFMRRHNGKLHRHPGGYWQGPVFDRHAENYATPTIEALVARGLATYVVFKDGRRGEQFPVIAMLTEQNVSSV